MKTSGRGSVLLEALICLPVLLLISLGVAQFAHIWLCRTLVHYAAYCGARAVVTAPSGAGNEQRWARRAAEVVCSTVAFLNPTGEADFILPGINDDAVIAGTGGVRRVDSSNSNLEILTVDVSSPDTFHRCVNVTMKVPLLFPLAGPVIGGTMRLFSENGFDPGPGTASSNPSSGDSTIIMQGDIFPRIILREQAYIVKPFLSTWNAD